MQKALKRHSREDGIRRRLIDGNCVRLPRCRIRKGGPLFPLASQCYRRLHGQSVLVQKDKSSSGHLEVTMAELHLGQRGGLKPVTVLAAWRVNYRRETRESCLLT